MDQPSPSAPLRLTNPYFRTPNPVKVSVWISAPAYNDMFCHILAGPKGPCQAIFAQFMQKFHHHLTVNLGLPVVYDPDNLEIVARELSFLNFNDQSLRPHSPGQPDSSSPKPKKKRPTNRNEPGATSGSSSSGPNPS